MDNVYVLSGYTYDGYQAIIGIFDSQPMAVKEGESFLIEQTAHDNIFDIRFNERAAYMMDEYGAYRKYCYFDIDRMKLNERIV